MKNSIDHAFNGGNVRRIYGSIKVGVAEDVKDIFGVRFRRFGI